MNRKNDATDSLMEALSLNAGPGLERETAISDFNNFFEKLSTLDEQSWAEDKKVSNKRVRGSSKGVRKPPPRMEVFRNTEPLAARVSEEARYLGAEQSERVPVAQVIKVVLVALLLFSVGLGGVWAALSLPNQMGGKDSALSNWLKRHNGSNREVASYVKPVTKAATVNMDEMELTEVLPKSAAEKYREITGRDLRPEAKAIADGTQSGIKGTASGVVSAKASTAASGATGSSNQANGAGRYALQVGACSSAACVQKYKGLLMRAVSPTAIQVTQQTRSNNQVVQRIRIAPITRGEAERIKVNLAAVDSRFRDAYLVTLR